jgi:hypothetical protein
MESTQEDALHRLAEAEKLVVELKDIISQKDVQLQQKDEALQVLLLGSAAERLIETLGKSGSYFYD